MPPVSPESQVQAPDPRDKAQQLGALVKSLRSRRLPKEQEMLRGWNAWRGVKTRSFFKSEIFDNFVPVARRAIEKNVIKATQMLMPSPDFFEVFPGNEMDAAAGDRAESVRAFFTYLLRKRIKTKALISQLMRTFYMYGRGIVKTGIVVEHNAAGLASVWPTARAVDPFCFYTWPETVPALDDASVIVEDHLMPWDRWEELREQGRLKNLPPLREYVEPEFPSHWAERLHVSGIPTPGSTGGDVDARKDEEVRPPKFVWISEVWYREKGLWKMCWLLWSCTTGPLIVREFIPRTMRHPYRMGVARMLPGESYTTCMMDDLEPLQVLYNDQMNMTLEGQATAFAPPAVIDPMLISRAGQFKYGPRQKWFCAVDGVKFLETPDTSANGYKGLATTMSLIESFSSDNPMSNGMPTRGMPRAGFAVSSMMNLALSDIKDASQTIEDDVLTPMMADLHALTLAYVPPDQIFRIPGTRNHPVAQQIAPWELDGDFEFQWVGSLQSQDQQVRAVRMQTTIQTFAKAGPLLQQDLAAQGKKLNWELMATRMWRDALGERGADSIVIPMTPQDMQNMAQAQQAASKPKVSVSLKGEIDPVVARDLVDDGQVNNSGGAPVAMGPGPDKKAPTTPEAATRQQSREQASPPQEGA